MNCRKERVADAGGLGLLGTEVSEGSCEGSSLQGDVRGKPCVHYEESGLDCTMMGPLSRREVVQADLDFRGTSLEPHKE